MKPWGRLSYSLAHCATCSWPSRRSRQYADARCFSPAAAGSQRGGAAAAPSWPAGAQGRAPRPCEHRQHALTGRHARQCA